MLAACYLHDKINFASSGRGGNQKARNPHSSNLDQIRIQIPPDRKIVDTIVSRPIGSR